MTAQGRIRPASGTPRLGSAAWALGTVAVCLVVGTAVSLRPTLAAVFVVAIGGGAIVTARPAFAAAALPLFPFLEGVLPLILILPLLGLGLAQLASGCARVRVAPPFVLGVLFVLWGFTSALWTPDLALTTKQYIGAGLALCFLPATACLIQDEEDLRFSLASFVATAAGTGAYGVASAALGLTARAEGFAGDPNIFGMYLVSSLPIALLLAKSARTQANRALSLIAAAVIAAAVLVTVSRGALIALGVVLLLLLIAPARAMYRSVPAKASIGIAVVLFAVVGFVAVGGDVRERSSDKDSAQGSGRVNEWKAGGTAFRSAPIRGIGLGGFYATSNQLMRETPGVDLARYRLARTGQRVHSAYIGAAAELGVIGLALFVSFLLATGASLWRSYRQPRSRGESPFAANAALALLLGLIGFAIASIFLSTETSTFVFLLAGLAVAVANPSVSARSG